MTEVGSPSSSEDPTNREKKVKIREDEEADWGACLEEEKHMPISPPNPGEEIPLSNEELVTWSKPWRNALIVKVLGKKMSFRLLESKLESYWVKQGTIRITDLVDDYYVVRFSSVHDYRHALFGGPWKIADHYLMVQRWKPLFSLSSSMTRRVVVWIRILKLPMELCNDIFLKRIGSSLGVMLKIDRLTSIQAWGKFARICIELDLDIPLPSHITIRGYQFCLEYEGFHLICFRCGKYGHKQEFCREVMETELGPASTVTSSTMDVVKEGCAGGNSN